MIQIAFYKAQGTVLNRLVRWWTNSPYSHCELVINPDRHHPMCWSSSSRDGGVRSKVININSGNWDVINVAWADRDTVMTARQTFAGAGYDWLGVFLFGVSTHWKSRWFCSEICATALGISNGHRFSPASLRTLILDINKLQLNDL